MRRTLKANPRKTPASNVKRGIKKNWRLLLVFTFLIFSLVVTAQFGLLNNTTNLSTRAVFNPLSQESVLGSRLQLSNTNSVKTANLVEIPLKDYTFERGYALSTVFKTADFSGNKNTIFSSKVGNNSQFLLSAAMRPRDENGEKYELEVSYTIPDPISSGNCASKSGSKKFILNSMQATNFFYLDLAILSSGKAKLFLNGNSFDTGISVGPSRDACKTYDFAYLGATKTNDNFTQLFQGELDNIRLRTLGTNELNDDYLPISRLDNINPTNKDTFFFAFNEIYSSKQIADSSPKGKTGKVLGEVNYIPD